MPLAPWCKMVVQRVVGIIEPRIVMTLELVFFARGCRNSTRKSEMPERGGCTVMYGSHTKYRHVLSYGWSKQKHGITGKELSWKKSPGPNHPPSSFQAAQTTSEQYLELEKK